MRRLVFVDPTADAYRAALADAAAEDPAAEIGLLGEAPAFAVALGLPDRPAPYDPARHRIVLLFGGTGEALSPHLARLLDAPAVTAIAPVTNHFHRNKVLFLVSIPKAGTHLLFELARALGFPDGGECLLMPKSKEEWAGRWYYLEHSNSHTAAPEFIFDGMRRRPFGNREHPFPRNPVLFIYRNPLDVLVSEATYYAEDGNVPFFSYLEGLPFEERLLRLVDDPWLMGTLRDRIGKFVAWLDFANAIPVSFEELVGPEGGGDARDRLDLIWSLQVRLHVPGRPEDIARTLFNPDSPTFRFGRIGRHRSVFTPAVWQAVRSLPQDFMAALGYDADAPEPEVKPAHADRFRRRMPRYGRARFNRTPIVEHANYLGHNIVKFDGCFYAVPLGGGDLDLGTLDEAALKALPHGQDLDALRHRLFLLYAALGRP